MQINSSIKLYKEPNFRGQKNESLVGASKINLKQSSSDSYVSKTSVPKNDKITLEEGVSIFKSGMLTQAKKIVKSLLKHPLKSIGIMGLTSAALMSLPLIGIPASVGGAVLTILFAGLASAKTIKHTINFVKNVSDGNNANARKDLEQMGGDTLNLALSVPFVPKGIKEINRFSKYGKIAYNTELVSNMASAKGIGCKIKELFKCNKEITRKINYSDALDYELSRCSGLDQEEKIFLKKYLEDYNVPKEKIHEVVMKKWADRHGIETQPFIESEPMPVGVLAGAKPDKCSISVNNYKKIIAPSKNPIMKYTRIKSKLIDGIYHDTYMNKETGELIHESVSKVDFDNRLNCEAQLLKLSPEARRISTLTHERTHIHDLARIARAKGRVGIENVTDAAWERYSNMIKEMPPVENEALELSEVAKLEDFTNYYTTAGYIKNQMEKNAVAAQTELHNNSGFRLLDRVFKITRKNTTSASKAIAQNTIRAQSATS